MKKNYLILSILLVFAIAYSVKTQAQIIYGTTENGGLNGQGVLFKYTSTPNMVTLVDFGQSGSWKTTTPAMSPTGNIIHASNGMIYGGAAWGGINGEGSIYEYNPNTDSVHLFGNFDYNSGSPKGGLVEAPSGVLYGNTEMGGNSYQGVLYKFDPTTSAFSIFHQLTTQEGGGIRSGMTLHSDGMIYCVASISGAHNKGAIIQINPTNDAVTSKFDFDTIYGYDVYGSLFSADNGKLYGLAHAGGTDNKGTIFEYDPVLDTVIVLFNFLNTTGASSTGMRPQGGVILVNGTLYGTALLGGINNQGVLFKYTLTSGMYTVLKSFDSTLTGAFPQGSLTLGNDGWLYGTCSEGGAFDYGTFFKYYPTSNTFIKLKDFNGLNGQKPTFGNAIEMSKLKFYVNDTIISSPPFNIQFTNKTPDPNKYIWQWQFGDGAVSYNQNPSHTYTNNGVYTVTLIANDTVLHKQDTLMKQKYINLSGATPCPVVANISPNGFIYICPGDSILLHSTNNDVSNSYQWLRSGLFLNGATDTVYWAKKAGYYQVRVNNGSCWNFSNIAFVQQYPVQPPIINSMGQIAPCSDDSIRLFLDKNYGNLLWSTGDTTAEIFVNKSGFYTVTTGDNNGCNVTSPIDTINASLVNPPNLCIVGVDSASGHNIIVWNQSTDVQIDSFRVYKEGVINNQFELIAAKARSETAMFIDVNSDPRKMAYRYRLMAIDSCGMETPVGPYHKTMHLQVNIGLGNTWNLHWNNYEGTLLGSYHIYRGTDSLQMQLVAVVPSTVHSYTDLNPPTGDVFYLLKVDLPKACNPGGGNTYSLSSSNFFNTKDATVGIEKIKMHDISLSVFPNPNNGQFTLKVESTVAKQMNVVIFNSLGSLIYSEQLNINGTLTKNMNLSNLSKGVYFIRLQTNDDVVIRKIIIQ